MHCWLKFGISILMAGVAVAPCRARTSVSGDSSGAPPRAPIAQGSSTAASHSAFRALADEVGVQCREPDKGEGCVAQDEADPHAGDYFDVELLPDCGEDGFYAGVVAAEGADLANRLPPEDTGVNATLSKDQLVCIRAIARSGPLISRYYVTAVPVADVAGCRRNDLCLVYGDRGVQWKDSPHVTPCRLHSTTGPVGDCASGWAADHDLEAFSLGFQSESGAGAATSDGEMALRDTYYECAASTNGITWDIQACMDAEFDYQDARLNAAYRNLMAKLSEPDKRALRSEERKWISARDSVCSWDAQTEGQAQRIEANVCALKGTAQRAATLEQRLLDTHVAADASDPMGRS